MTTYALKKSRAGMVTYSYRDTDWGFSTTLFCEVGAPYQQWFREEIHERGWVIETRELEEKPYLADFV